MADPNVLRDAPVICIEYPVDEEPILACLACLPWSVEVVLDHPLGPHVREWHAIGCPVLAEWGA